MKKVKSESTRERDHRGFEHHTEVLKEEGHAVCFKAAVEVVARPEDHWARKYYDTPMYTLACFKPC